MQDLPLEGMRVVDFSQGVAGPVCAMLLADLGADVIKVEPKRGDWIRQTGRKVERGMSPIYVSMNRNKRGICLELREARGLDLARRLIADADVVVQSFRPGVMEQMQLGYEQLSADHPGLIYASITGYGREGPYRDLPGTDSIIQAMGGIMSLNGADHGEPLRFGMFMVDVITGNTALQGVLAALLARGRSGKGQRVDVSLLDAILAFQGPPLTEYLMYNQLPERNGNVNAWVAPSGVFPTADGSIMLTVFERTWDAFCAAAGLQDLQADPRFATNPSRLNHREPLIAAVKGAIAQRTTDAWLTAMREADVLCAPINEYDAVVRDPQVLANQVLETLNHPSFGPLPLVHNPVRYGGMSLSYRPPPMLGEHTRQVLEQVLHLGPGDVDALIAAQVAYETPADQATDVA